MRAAKARKFEQGQAVWLTGKIVPGMFPAERYFYVEIEPGRAVCGYVPQDKVKNDRILAVVMEVVGNRVNLLFPGELICASNPVSAPIPWLLQHASA